MIAPTATGLKLRVSDEEDLKTVAALLQDALVLVRDIGFMRQQNRFVFVANRFRWEDSKQDTSVLDNKPPSPGDADFHEAGETHYGRIHCGICVDFVRTVRVKGIDRSKPSKILNLLTVDLTASVLRFVFSEGAEIRIEISKLRVFLTDLGEAWPTPWRPRHALDDQQG